VPSDQQRPHPVPALQVEQALLHDTVQTTVPDRVDTPGPRRLDEEERPHRRGCPLERLGELSAGG
jgi:hypothetical protein